MIPHLYHNLLHDIFSLLMVHRDAQRHAEEFVFKWQYVVLEVQDYNYWFVSDCVVVFMPTLY